MAASPFSASVNVPCEGFTNSSGGDEGGMLPTQTDPGMANQLAHMVKWKRKSRKEKGSLSYDQLHPIIIIIISWIATILKMQSKVLLI